MSAKKRDSKRSEGRPNASETPGVWRHRAPERLLLLFVALAFLAIYAKMLALRPPSAPPLQWLDLLPALAFLTALVITHLSLLFTFSRADPVLPAITLFLSGIGLVAQLRMHSYDFANISRLSNYALPAGLMLMLATAFLCRKGRAALLGRCGWLSWAVACAVLGGILAFGRRYRGAVFLPGNINPAEVVKVLLVIFIAAYVAKHREALRERAPLPIPSLRYLILFVAWLAPMVLLVLQRDLGMIVLLNAVLFVVLFMATRRWSLLALTAG
ncbi:MAG: FtsW/RodA/SpoVE family cell cycle protein, partial [Lentisphaeria bacterium]|nr:FtsW/RodA/SpoVE family cell cycle protein [Lentisphaeria bacterium]